MPNGKYLSIQYIIFHEHNRQNKIINALIENSLSLSLSLWLTLFTYFQMSIVHFLHMYILLKSLVITFDYSRFNSVLYYVELTPF